MNIGDINTWFHRSRWLLLVLCIIVVTGFSFKAYSGPGCNWFNDYGAAVMYEIFWCLIVFLFVPSPKRIIPIALSVFLITSVLEVLQLWHPWFLEQIRSTFPGRALIGTTFVWWDFPHYLIGCLIAVLCMRAFSKSLNRSTPRHNL